MTETAAVLDQTDTWMPKRVERRLNALCPYYTMFPLDFPLTVLSGSQRGQWLLDPFCGRGTSLFAARLRGLNAIGIDVSPVAAAMAAAKFVQVSGGEITRRAAELLGADTPVAVPEGEFWELCYHPSTLAAICRLRLGLRARPESETDKGLIALLLGVLHGPRNKGAPSYLSNQMPRTYSTKPSAAVRYWRKHSLDPAPVDVLDVISRRADFSFADVPSRVAGEAILGDAADVIRELRPTFSWVLTSPPYYGMRTYLPDQWLRGWFLGGRPDVDYQCGSQLPQSSVEVFTEALAKVWRGAADVCLDGARLVIRFGALPSKGCRSVDILQQSLAMSVSGWRVTTQTPSGAPANHRRQATQFTSAGPYADEIDVYARLEG